MLRFCNQAYLQHIMQLTVIRVGEEAEVEEEAETEGEAKEEAEREVEAGVEDRGRQEGTFILFSKNKTI